MVWQISKVLIAASIISLASWLAGRQPRLAGFILALPISTMTALVFSHAEFEDPAKAVSFAKSIFVGVLVSLLFFVPFLFADRIPTGFWGLFGLGVLLLAVGYFLHAGIVK